MLVICSSYWTRIFAQYKKCVWLEKNPEYASLYYARYGGKDTQPRTLIKREGGNLIWKSAVKNRERDWPTLPNNSYVFREMIYWIGEVKNHLLQVG